MADAPDVWIEASDAMQLGQVLDFLAAWFSRDDSRPTDAYLDFVGHDGADLTEVRDIVARFAFLLVRTTTGSDCSDAIPIDAHQGTTGSSVHWAVPPSAPIPPARRGGQGRPAGPPCSGAQRP